MKNANDVSKAAQTLTLNRRHLVSEHNRGGRISLIVMTLINIYLIRKSVYSSLKALPAESREPVRGIFNQLVE